MEEILASIRRIIEDNDTGRKSGDPDPVRHDDDGVRESTVIEVDAFRTELRTPPVEVMEGVSLLPAPPEKKAVTLAEVQAQIAAEARFAPAPRWTPEPTPALRPAAVVEKTPEAADRPAIVESAAPSPGAIETFDAAVSKPVSDVKPVAAEDRPEAASDEKPVEMADEPEAASVPAINRPVAPEGAVSRPVILSERAERKVAAAFGELSEAFAARSKKTFDDMAEEMMRPMLQDWLDNNLPTLVERLVREEIERVARGA